MSRSAAKLASSIESSASNFTLPTNELVRRASALLDLHKEVRQESHAYENRLPSKPASHRGEVRSEFARLDARRESLFRVAVLCSSACVRPRQS